MIHFSRVSAVPRMLKDRDWSILSKELTRILRFRQPREVGVTFVSEATMQKVNRQFRGKDRATDVLSFASADVNMPKKDGKYLGDLVICAPYAAHEAARRGIPVREELIRLLAHGVLHLAGYDHATEAEETVMFTKQERCVTACLSL